VVNFFLFKDLPDLSYKKELPSKLGLSFISSLEVIWSFRVL
jgi:hypothetical protein